MGESIKDWREFLKGERSRSSVHFIEEYFTRRGIDEPTLEQIKNIPVDDLLNSWISMRTVKEIQLLQQKDKLK